MTPRRKAKDSNYYAVHKWLKDKANKCENNDCNYKNPKRFEYALIKGKELSTATTE